MSWATNIEECLGLQAVISQKNCKETVLEERVERRKKAKDYRLKYRKQLKNVLKVFFVHHNYIVYIKICSADVAIAKPPDNCMDH